MERRKLTREQVEEIVTEARDREKWPDLNEADLTEIDLREVDLRGTNFRRTYLKGADLTKANLIGSDLKGANLSEASLREADLTGAYLKRANLSRADLSETNFTTADLTEADFSGADLTRANLSAATLTGANLIGANLIKAYLKAANLTQVKLEGADLSKVIIGDTSFIGVDLSQVKGLTEVKHKGPSIIDINTIYRSKGKIPEIFLEKAGVDTAIIRWQHSLHTRPTVFISYSHKDEKEKDELLTYLRALEREDLLTVWHDEHIRVGTDWKQEIKQAISKATVALLLITPNFLASDFINDEEIPEFLKRQESEEDLVIFPVIAKQCAWSRLGWLAKMQVRPKGGKAIWGKSRSVDTELAKITDEVIEVIRSRWLR